LKKISGKHKPNLETQNTVSKIKQAIDERDAHLRAVIEWHFNPETGCPFWLSQVSTGALGFDPREKIKTFEDIVEHFPNFDGDKHLRTVPASEWQPKGFPGGNWSMFMTGGTTGDPKRRWGRLSMDSDGSDYAWDYTTFSQFLPTDGFPTGGSCLYIGPQGPRRLPRGVEVLARLRNAGFNNVDMDVAWMKNPNNASTKAYKDELVARAVGAIRRDKPDWVFCPPILIEAIGEVIDWTQTTVKGVFAGGTEMDPETVRNIMENLFKGKIRFVPTYGNALVGLARPRAIATLTNEIEGQRPYSIIYQPLQPRTLLRIVNPKEPKTLVDYGTRGYVEITTLTREWFMPRFLERDEAERTPPTEEHPWDGVCEVSIPAELRDKIQKGVY
jgi:hypothetical protein